MADRTVQNGLHVVSVPLCGCKQLHIAAHAGPDDSPRDLARAVAAVLRGANAAVLAAKGFGTLNAADGVVRALAEEVGGEWCATTLGSGCLVDGATCQVQVQAQAGAAIEPVRLGDWLLGTAFEDDAARYCLLGSLRAHSTGRTRPDQAREVLETMEAGLAAAGMDFTHVLRTWFHLRDILSWYGVFNEVRTRFFGERRVFDGVVPASTGVGIGVGTCGPEHGSAGLAQRVEQVDSPAVVAELLAIRPKRADVKISSVASPLQCCAREYGSSFSRAVEVEWPGRSGLRGVRRLYVSGTASIDGAGRTLHAGDVRGQMAETMAVVRAILDSRGMDWADVASGVAYFKRPEDAPALAAYAKQHGLPALPLALTCGDICRDELLFEIELEAWGSDG